MLFDVVALGVVSGLRPATSTAAVIALLRAPDPRRSLLAFTATGLAFTIAIGTVAVVAFDGVGRAVGREHFAAWVYLVAGIAALGFATALAHGRARLPHRSPSSNGGGRIAQRLRHPTLITAGFAGIATHVPGLLYLVALNAIAAAQLSPSRETFQIAVYNVLWFLLPVTALVLAIFAPESAQRYLHAGTEWTRDHQDRIVLVLFFALGVYLTVKGGWELASR